jgi:hypothetical protein
MYHGTKIPRTGGAGKDKKSGYPVSSRFKKTLLLILDVRVVPDSKIDNNTDYYKIY